MSDMKQETSDQVGYKKLIVWQKAHLLVKEIYEATKKFPRDELFGLISQMRRCAISVPANIVEGYSRRTIKDKLNFYVIARASLSELEYYIDLSYELGYISKAMHEELVSKRSTVGRLLNGFINSFK